MKHLPVKIYLDYWMQKSKKWDLSWKNCISFAADNASVMQGLQKGVAHYLLKENSGMYILGCPCHLMNLAAQKACSKLPLSVDDLLVDIYYYLGKKQQQKTKSTAVPAFQWKGHQKILKHVGTHWLSLEIAINRLIEQWEPVRTFLMQNTRVQRKLCPRLIQHLV
ncbi:hypothetical protein HOLleu_00782 [Holothuria leucospilota]|uniref:Uncharacterized protein n=1 Tax=Holothuria leucospilota TaxID=206669 RepID=A0A9Q1CN69_HOLLE|nr:hypothetical protein HOLleu_00782 [Holothuria leucospilota]